MLGTFTHHNFPVYSPTLEQATLTINYDIDVVNGSIGGFSGTSTFIFNHEETRNNANPCSNGGANGSGVNRFGCADLVKFTVNQALTDTFTVDGQKYQLLLTGFRRAFGLAYIRRVRD